MILGNKIIKSKKAEAVKTITSFSWSTNANGASVVIRGDAGAVFSIGRSNISITSGGTIPASGSVQLSGTFLRDFCSNISETAAVSISPGANTILSANNYLSTTIYGAIPFSRVYGPSVSVSPSGNVSQGQVLNVTVDSFPSGINEVQISFESISGAYQNVRTSPSSLIITSPGVYQFTVTEAGYSLASASRVVSFPRTVISCRLRTATYSSSTITQPAI